MLKKFIIALSLANLCLYEVIFTLFYKKLFFVKHLPTANTYLALMLSELILATFLLIMWETVVRLKKPFLVKIAKAFVFILVLTVLYDSVRDFDFINYKIFRLCLLIITLLLLILKKTTKAAVTFILIAAPFVAVIFTQSLLGFVTHWNKAYQSNPVSALFASNNSNPRVLWLIFDEMDYQVAFNERPQGYNFPTFDRFREQAIFAENAFPPSDSTTISMTSLIDGRLVSSASPIGTDQLMITYRDTEEAVNWGSCPNTFSKARNLKINTALIGEYLPYSRLIGKDLSYCSWHSYYPEYISHIDSLSANIYSQLYFVLAGPAKGSIQRKRSFYNVLKDAKNIVANPDYGLIMIHFPIPHGPHFYKNPWWEQSAEGYLNALVLADETLKQLWEIMEDKDLWEQTTVIISSDHYLRKHKKHFKYKNRDFRIPFILKMAGQKKAITYQQPFNTFITSDLILAILRKEVSTADEVINWLDENKKNPIIKY